MENKKRKRKTCIQCNEEYSARHLSRHACIPNEETVKEPLHQTSSAVNTDTSQQDIDENINLPTEGIQILKTAIMRCVLMNIYRTPLTMKRNCYLLMGF